MLLRGYGRLRIGDFDELYELKRGRVGRGVPRSTTSGRTMDGTTRGPHL